MRGDFPETVPYGLCHCGCGEKTKIALKSNTMDGYIKGDNKMKMVRLDEEYEVREFAKKAARSFAENEQFITFTDGDIEAGCLFAIRWGFGDDCVLVFRLDEDFEPVNYQQLIEKYVGDTEDVGQCINCTT